MVGNKKETNRYRRNEKKTKIINFSCRPVKNDILVFLKVITITFICCLLSAEKHITD